MIGFVSQVGPAGWPLAVISVALLGLFLKHAVTLFGKGSGADVDLGGVKFLGALGLSVGAFSTLLGWYQGLQLFSHFSSDQVAGGFSQALLSLIFGLFIFIIALVLRFILHLRLKKLQSGSQF